MRRLLIVILLIAVNQGTGFARQRSSTARPKSIIVAFYDQNRLNGRSNELESFKFFLSPIQEIAKRDFPDIEFRILTDSTLVRLPDGTGLNVRNIQPVLGFVLSAQGKKRRILSGPQSEQDFACAAASYFRRSSKACTK
jgi:hypothetical protein